MAVPSLFLACTRGAEVVEWGPYAIPASAIVFSQYCTQFMQSKRWVVNSTRIASV